MDWFFLQLKTVPHEFVIRWMSKIKGKKYKVILLFENKPRQWNVTFMTYERNAGFFCGWRAFAVANGLQKGDKCVFRLVDKVKYIFKVHVIGHELHEDRGGRHKEINITSAHALVPHEKMKTSVVKIDPYRLVESIIPQCMAEYIKGSRMRGSMVGYESHNPFEITYIQGPTENTQIEVIEID